MSAAVCLCVCVCRPLVMSLSVIVMQTMPGRQAGGSRQSVSPRQSSSSFPPGAFCHFSDLAFHLHFQCHSGRSPSPSLSLSLADIRNLPLQINCEVMAVTSLLPVSLPSPPLLRLLFSRSFSLLTRVSMR